MSKQNWLRIERSVNTHRMDLVRTRQSSTYSKFNLKRNNTPNLEFLTRHTREMKNYVVSCQNQRPRKKSPYSSLINSSLLSGKVDWGNKRQGGCQGTQTWECGSKWHYPVAWIKNWSNGGLLQQHNFDWRQAVWRQQSFSYVSVILWWLILWIDSVSDCLHYYSGHSSSCNSFWMPWLWCGWHVIFDNYLFRWLTLQCWLWHCYLIGSCDSCLWSGCVACTIHPMWRRTGGSWELQQWLWTVINFTYLRRCLWQWSISFCESAFNAAFDVMLPMFGSVQFSRVFEWPELDPGQCFLNFTEPEPEPLLTLVQVKKRFRSGLTPGWPQPTKIQK